MKLVALVLALAAMAAAIARIARIRGSANATFRRVRYNLFAVISASLMVLTPLTLGDVWGRTAATWVALGFAVLALALLFLGERVKGKD